MSEWTPQKGELVTDGEAWWVIMDSIEEARNPAGYYIGGIITKQIVDPEYPGDEPYDHGFCHKPLLPANHTLTHEQAWEALRNISLPLLEYQWVEFDDETGMYSLPDGEIHFRRRDIQNPELCFHEHPSPRTLKAARGLLQMFEAVCEWLKGVQG